MSAADWGALGYRALLAEVDATPKPGLVDRDNNGAHADMDHALFLASAAAIRPYFCAFALLGMDTAGLGAGEAFKQMRPTGQQAEQAMLFATGGVNTHKGAIFSLGLLLAALGRIHAQAQDGHAACVTVDAVCDTAAAFVAGICARELGARGNTKGERAYLLHGMAGVRGEAEAGFPSVRQCGLPAYRAWLSRGASDQDALCAALLSLIAAVPDTNILTRHNIEVATYAQAAARDCIAHIEPLAPGSAAWRAPLHALDADFIRRNISPGGCADLLACSWFLHRAVD